MLLDTVVLVASILFLMASVWEYTKLKALEVAIEEDAKMIRSKVMETRIIRKENKSLLSKVREDLARKVSLREVDSLVEETNELLSPETKHKKVHSKVKA